MSTKGVAATHLTTLAAWTILPPLATRISLSALYRLSPSLQPRLPPSASPSQIQHQSQRAEQHNRKARIVLVVLYLFYTLLSTYTAQNSSTAPQHKNFYHLLGLPRSVVESEGPPAVKSHFRKLARVFHPDKVGVAGQDYFVALRRASECLEDENKRWAYERWGDEVLDWGKAVQTKREFVVRGSQGVAGFYCFAVGSLVLLSLLRKEERAYGFWRSMTLLLTLSLEFFLSLRPSPSPLMSLLIPHRLPYEQIHLLRQVFLSSTLAFSQLAPLLYPPPPPLPTYEQIDAELLAIQTSLFVPLLQSVDVPPEEDHPEKTVHRQAHIVKDVKDGVLDLMTEMRIRQNPAVGQVWNEAVRAGGEREEKRRRAHTSAGSGALFGGKGKARGKKEEGRRASDEGEGEKKVKVEREEMGFKAVKVEEEEEKVTAGSAGMIPTPPKDE